MQERALAALRRFSERLRGMPKGSVRLNVPDGVTIFVDGQPVAVSPIEGLTLAIGSHEISARHPTLGERRLPLDVKNGGLTEATLRFE